MNEIRIFILSIERSLIWTIVNKVDRVYKEKVLRTAAQNVPSSNLLFRCGLIVIFHKSTFYYIA